MNSNKKRYHIARLKLIGFLLIIFIASSIADTGPVSDPNSDCIAIDFYDIGLRTFSVTGLVQEHQSSPTYPTNWAGEVDIPWEPEHNSSNDPIVINSFVRDGLRLTGTSINGDAWVQFALRSPRDAVKELFLFITAINARPSQCIGEILGIIDLSFEGGHVESYELKIGHNIRNWWSGNDYVSYVFSFTPGSYPEAREIDLAPANDGWIGLDVVRLVVPDPYCHKGLKSIRITAKPVKSWNMDVSLRLSGISLFTPYPPYLEFSAEQVSDLSMIQPASLTWYNHAGNQLHSWTCYSGLANSYYNNENICNNPHFRCWKNHGPIPPGTWIVREAGWNGDGRKQRSTWYPLVISDVKPGDIGNRNPVTFNIHGLNKIGTTGCIGIEPGEYYNNFRIKFGESFKVKKALKSGNLKLDVKYIFDDPLMKYDPNYPAIVTHIVNSPVNLFLQTANGHVCGYDPITGEIVNDIDGATYSGPGTEPQSITYPLTISNYSIDRLMLLPIGDGGSYHLETIYKKLDGNIIATEQTGEALEGNPAGYLVRLASDSVKIKDDKGYADLNYDCTVNLNDFAIFASNWLDTNCVFPSWCGGADIDHNSIVDIIDLSLIFNFWLNESFWY